MIDTWEKLKNWCRSKGTAFDVVEDEIIFDDMLLFDKQGKIWVIYMNYEYATYTKSCLNVNRTPKQMYEIIKNIIKK